MCAYQYELSFAPDFLRFGVTFGGEQIHKFDGAKNVKFTTVT